MARYGKKAGQKVKRAMHERKRGTLEERAIRKKGKESQASDCDRSVGSAPRRRKGAAQEIEKEIRLDETQRRV